MIRGFFLLKTKILTIETKLDEQSDVEYTLTDASGHVLNRWKKERILEDKQSLHLKHWAAGIYYLTIKNGEKEETRQFAKM